MNATPVRYIRRGSGLALFGLSFWIWTVHSDVVALIVREKPVLFGRYSMGHMGVLLLLTPTLWTLAAVCWSRRPFGEALGNGVLGIVTTIAAMLAITYLAHFFHPAPRYIESHLPDDKKMHLAGAVRHRPPGEIYRLTYIDVPEMARGYPDAPPGHPPVPVVLTSDARGFRNTGALLPRYDILAVGDSFVAGSNVSDDQCWTALLAAASGRSIYNLGVGGSGPPTYLSNFAYFGLELQPRLALFMIYEGNDFKEDVVIEGARSYRPSLWERVRNHIDFAMHSSPVTLGLKRLSQRVFETADANRPVPDYAAKVGWMPLRVTRGGVTHYYSFDPKRVIYLNYGRAAFAATPEWRSTAQMLEQILQLSRSHHIQPVFIYAPSKPHVVMPLAADAIPAVQLRNFLAYKKHHLPDADTLKRQVFANLGSEEQVVMDFCRTHDVPCLSLTPALSAATAAGAQTYFTYDQHWSPAGNAVAARAIGDFLRDRGLL